MIIEETSNSRISSLMVGVQHQDFKKNLQKVQLTLSLWRHQLKRPRWELERKLVILHRKSRKKLRLSMKVRTEYKRQVLHNINEGYVFNIKSLRYLCQYNATCWLISKNVLSYWLFVFLKLNYWLVALSPKRTGTHRITAIKKCNVIHLLGSTRSWDTGEIQP